MGRYSETAKRLSAMLAHEPTRALAVKELAPVFREHDGNAVRIAEAIGMGRRTLNYWIAEYPEVRTAIDKARAAAGK